MNFLLLKFIHQIPWQSLPPTKKQAISRMLAIHFLLSHIRPIYLKLTFYIVDPGGDLTYTQKKFQPFFEKKKNWKGLIGVAPDESQFKKTLTEYDIFMKIKLEIYKI